MAHVSLAVTVIGQVASRVGHYHIEAYIEVETGKYKLFKDTPDVSTKWVEHADIDLLLEAYQEEVTACLNRAYKR